MRRRYRITPSAVVLCRGRLTSKFRAIPNACLILLGLFPLFLMFIITSITMQRERASGTLEWILTTPLGQLDLMIAYGTAFSIAAAAQAVLACIVSFWFLGFDTKGNPVWVFVIAIINAVLGVGLGLLCSAFARTEFRRCSSSRW